MKQRFRGFSVWKKVLLWSILLALFLVLVFLTSVSYVYPSSAGLLGVITRFHFEAMLFVALSGLAIGAAGIFIFSSELQKTTNSLKTNTELLLSFLSQEERQAVQLIIDKGGSAFQPDIAKMHGMTRLKAHRIITRLSDRKILNVHSYGKINMVTLSPVILSAFNLKPSIKREKEKNE